MQYNIVDFSPEWDFTTGGQKLLICINNPGIIDLSFQSRISCQFGDGE